MEIKETQLMDCLHKIDKTATREQHKKKTGNNN